MPRGESKAWPDCEGFPVEPVTPRQIKIGYSCLSGHCHDTKDEATACAMRFQCSVHLLEDKEIRCTESPWVHGIAYATSTSGVTCVECLRKKCADMQETINGLQIDLEYGRKGEFPPATTIRHLQLDEDTKTFRCGKPYTKELRGTFDNVNCVHCLKLRVLELVDECNERYDARGKRRDVFIRCLADFEKAVLEEDAACTIAGVTKDLMRGEKMHRRYRKAEVMLINLREQLVKMACGEKSE